MNLKINDLYKFGIIEDILNRSNDGINIVNTEGILIYANKVSADYTNAKAEDMIGNPISQYYPKAVLLQALEKKCAILDKKIHFIGSKKYIVSAYPIYINQQFMGAFSIFKDIQEIDELNNKIKYLQLHLKLNEPEKDVFSIIGKNGSLSQVVEKARRTVASLGGPRHSIIIGESGTGKTMLANLIYDFAKDVHVIDEKAPFIEINCGQFTNPDIAAVEIFGSEEGAYTGAKQKKGLFEQANRGILFLDEAHALKQYQTMLLKAVESGKIRRIGGSKEIPVDVIIIAASTKNLKEEMLPELYQRLAQYELYLPALNERSLAEKRDLLRYFVDKYAKAVGELHGIQYHVEFSQEAEDALLAANYPRNIRQFRDIVNYSIDSAAPLISDIINETEIFTKVDLENLPFDTYDLYHPNNDAAYRNDLISPDAAKLVHAYRNKGYGPRIISKKLEEHGYHIEFYKIAYYLKKHRL